MAASAASMTNGPDVWPCWVSARRISQCRSPGSRIPATPKLQSLSRRSGRALGCECRELRGEFHILGNPARGRSFHVAPQYPTREGGLLAGSSAVDPADQIVPKASRPPTRHSVTPSLKPTRLLQAGQKRTRWTPDSQNVDGIPCDETARTGATRTLNLRVGGSIPPPRLTTNTEEINTGFDAASGRTRPLTH